MDVPPVKPPHSATGSGSNEGSALPELPFSVGQRLFARVVQVLSESDVVLDLAGQRLRASAPLPLAPGQVLDVAVRSVAPAIDLELLEAPVRFSEEAYALAAVMTAKQASGSASRLTPSQTQALLEMLAAPDATGAGAAPDSARAQLARALRPVPLESDASALADRFRHAVAASGVFLEAKLAAVVAARDLRELPGLREDVRVLLAQVTTETIDSPDLERARTALVADTMGRQLDVASHKLKDDEVRLDIPVSVDAAPTDVRMRVRGDPPRGERDERPNGRVIDLTLQLPELGRVRAWLRWTPGHVAARFAVENAAAEAVLGAGLDALVTRLTTVGFRQVTAEVAVDPAALSEVVDDSDPPMPGGSILRVRA